VLDTESGKEWLASNKEMASINLGVISQISSLPPQLTSSLSLENWNDIRKLLQLSQSSNTGNSRHRVIRNLERFVPPHYDPQLTVAFYSFHSDLALVSILIISKVDLFFL
jgi:hypothetical protein